MSFPGRTGELLDLRELEQLVDQLSACRRARRNWSWCPAARSAAAECVSRASATSPGGSPPRATTTATSAPASSRWAWVLDWDSPLGLADQLNLRANRDAVTDRWRHSDSQSLFYSLPWGWWTFTYGYSQSDYRTRRASGFPSSSMATAAAISSAPNACCTATV